MSGLRRHVLALPLAVFLLFTTYNGFVEGYNATHYADTPGMKVATGFQLAYGLLGALGLFVLVRRPSWSRIALMGWSLAVIAEGGLAPIVYAGKGISFGLGTATAVATLAGLAYWGWVKSAPLSTVGTPAA